MVGISLQQTLKRKRRIVTPVMVKSPSLIKITLRMFKFCCTTPRHLLQMSQTSVAGYLDLLRSCVELIEGTARKIAPRLQFPFSLQFAKQFPENSH